MKPISFTAACWGCALALVLAAPVCRAAASGSSLAITSALTKSGVMGDTFDYYITTNQGAADTYAADPLPLGLSLDDTSGEISGTPEQAGTFKVNISATIGKSTAKAVLVLNIIPMVIICDPSVTFVQGDTVNFGFITNVRHNDVAYDAYPLPNNLQIGQDMSRPNLISGQLLQVGTYQVTLKADVTNFDTGDDIIVTKPLTINILPFKINSALLIYDFNGDNFLYSITTNGHADSYDATLGTKEIAQTDPDLPPALPNLDFDPNGGTIYGNLAKNGTFNITLTATNAATTAKATLKLVVSNIVIQSPNQVIAYVNDTSFYFPIIAAGASGSYTYGPMPPPTNWPGWLVLDPYYGTLSGPANVLGPAKGWPMTLYAYDMNDSRLSGSQKVTVFSLPQEPALTSPLNVTTTVGLPFSYTITANGIFPISYEVNGLPTGLTVSTDDETGTIYTISGTPTQSGNYGVIINASNVINNGNDAVMVPFLLHLNVQAVPFQIVSSMFVTGYVGDPSFAYTIQYVGTQPLALSVSGIPPGLTYSAGNITGTPSIAGLFPVTVTGINFAGAKTSTLLIEPDGDMAVASASLKVNLTLNGQDSLTISGSLPVPDNWFALVKPQIKGKLATLDFGGVNRIFPLNVDGKAGLDSKGNAVPEVNGKFTTTPVDTFTLSKPSKGISKFSLKLTKGSFSDALADEGVTPDITSDSSPLLVHVTMLFNGFMQHIDMYVNFTVKSGVLSGSYKKPPKSSSPF